jgi:hypothetical protein
MASGSDTFPSDGNLGSPWTSWNGGSFNGVFTVSSGILRGSGNDCWYYVNFPESSGYVAMEAVEASQTPTNRQLSLTISDNSQNAYMFRRAFNGAVQLLRNGSNVGTQVTGAISTYVASTLKLEKNGSTIKLYVDGTERWTYTDGSPITITKVSVSSEGVATDSTNAGFDSVSWTDTAAAAAQLAAPASDISAGNWVRSLDNAGTGLYTMLDEPTYDDNDYVYVNSDSTLEVKFASVSDPATSTGHKVRYRIKGNGAATITVSLRQGTGTEIASWAHTAASTTTTSYEQTLSSGQADSITDYADLRLRFVTFTP